MAWSERVLSGRPSRRGGEAWAGSAGHRAPSGQVDRAPVASPVQDEAALALVAEARRTALEQGLAEGRARGEQDLAAAVAAAQVLAHKLETAVPKDVDMLARTVAELAVLIARRILGAELRHDPSVLVAAIEAGLRQAAGASVITVELHPMVVDTVEAVWVSRHGARHRGFTWSFTGDPTLPADGCRLRTEHGLIDAGFEDQLSQVAAALDSAIPGYLGAALGPNADAALAAERTERLGPDAHEVPDVPGRAASRRRAAAAVPPAAPAPDESAPPVLQAGAAPALLGDAAGLPADLDLADLAGLGLGDLDPEALAALGLAGGPEIMG